MQSAESTVRQKIAYIEVRFVMRADTTHRRDAGAPCLSWVCTLNSLNCE
jgi:hypothetical protein